MSESQIILQHIENDICTISLHRPQVHNAFNDALIAELTQTLHDIDKKKDIRAVILNAHGETFSAGADLHWMQKMNSLSRQENEADALKLSILLESLNTLSQPTIALVQGRAVGGGIGLVACCDIAIAAEEAQFCFAEVKLGLLPATIAPYILQKMGYSATRRYFITAERFNATTAQQLGLIHDIVPKAQLQEAAIKLLEQIVKNGPNAMMQSKRLIHRLSPFKKSIGKEMATLLAEVRSSDEGKEGIQAFLEKRTPKWRFKQS